ncbi:hypothetical protein NPIL_353461 [Nephila pilipes]|uniref:Uncharacterized protein n=1 Tax=Nephila pilipes TaxID=299642 RepID=A0A8X6PA19_NEPPI|nr:hypothetical protein NPIL_353461 [Nephila pilipes]
MSIEFATAEATGKRLVVSSTVIPIVKMIGSKINSAPCYSELEKKLKESVLVLYKKRFGILENWRKFLQWLPYWIYDSKPSFPRQGLFGYMDQVAQQ